MTTTRPPQPSGPIDLAHLQRQTMGDEALAAELLGLFARQARAILEDLSAARAPRGRTEADLLHTLCGSARAVGAWDVAEGAERLEALARQGEHGRDGLGALGRSVDAAEAAIARLGPEALAAAGPETPAVTGPEALAATGRRGGAA